MQPVTKTFIAMTAAGFGRGPSNIEVTDEADAVQKTLAQRCIAFNTYDVTSVTLNGQELKGEPENRSGRRYVGIDRLYTRDEVIADMQKPQPGMRSGNREFDQIFADAVRGVIAEFRKHPADAAYITGLERPGEFIRLKEDEKVFDRNGTQLWPKPAGVPKTAAVFKP